MGKARIPIVECAVINDVFATELAQMEYLPGGCARLTFAAQQRAPLGGVERRVVAHIVIPRAILSVVVELLAAGEFNASSEDSMPAERLMN